MLNGLDLFSGIGGITIALANGPFNPKLDVLHACDTPPCVNPAHLSLGTDSDNMKDASAKRRHVQSKKTHCPKGHPYYGKNLAISKHHDTKTDGCTNRVCRTCHKIRQRARWIRMSATHLEGTPNKACKMRGVKFTNDSNGVTCRLCLVHVGQLSPRAKET